MYSSVDIQNLKIDKLLFSQIKNSSAVDLDFVSNIPIDNLLILS